MPTTKQTEDAFKKALKETETQETHTPKELEAELKEFTDKGVSFEFEGDTFTMNYGGREDSGNINQPLNNVKMAARRLIGDETMRRLEEQERADKKAQDAKAEKAAKKASKTTRTSSKSTK